VCVCVCYTHFDIHTLIYTLSSKFSPHSFLYISPYIPLYISIFIALRRTRIIRIARASMRAHTHTHTHRNWSGACLYTSLNSSESYGLHGPICTHMYPYPWTALPCYTIYIHISCHARTYVKTLYICGAKWGTYPFLKGPFSVHVDQYIYRYTIYLQVSCHAYICILVYAYLKDRSFCVHVIQYVYRYHVVQYVYRNYRSLLQKSPIKETIFYIHTDIMSYNMYTAQEWKNRTPNATN